MPKRKFIFCRLCKDDPISHFATHYYGIKNGFFEPPRKEPVCEKYLENNNIRLSNPNVSPINEGGS